MDNRPYFRSGPHGIHQPRRILMRSLCWGSSWLAYAGGFGGGTEMRVLLPVAGLRSGQIQVQHIIKMLVLRSSELTSEKLAQKL